MRDPYVTFYTAYYTITVSNSTLIMQAKFQFKLMDSYVNRFEELLSKESYLTFLKS